MSIESTEPRLYFLRREIDRLNRLLEQPKLAPFVVEANRKLRDQYQAEWNQRGYGDAVERAQREEVQAHRPKPWSGTRSVYETQFPAEPSRRSQSLGRRTITLNDVEYGVLMSALLGVRRHGGFVIGLSMEDSVDLDQLREKIAAARIE